MPPRCMRDLLRAGQNVALSDRRDRLDALARLQGLKVRGSKLLLRVQLLEVAVSLVAGVQ